MSSISETVDFESRPQFAMRSFGLSDRGVTRKTNEDCFATAELGRILSVQQTNLPQAGPSAGSQRAFVYLVADGLGGCEAGEIASGLSVMTIEDFLLNTLRRFSNLQSGEEEGALRSLQDALRRADARLFEETVEHPEWKGMGSTLTMAFAVHWRLFVAHAGDSRCYLYSGGELCRLTRDHTLPGEMVRLGMISAKQAAGHPLRNIVTNVLGGLRPGVEVEVHALDLHPDDIVLLCSDGLTEMVADDGIAALLRQEADPQRACELLVAEANRRGGRDNITAIVARVAPALK